MRVLAASEDHFVVDPADGKDFAVVVRLGEDGTVKLYPRINSAESIVRFGVWHEPTEEQTRQVLAALQGVTIPDPVYPPGDERG